MMWIFLNLLQSQLILEMTPSSPENICAHFSDGTTEAQGVKWPGTSTHLLKQVGVTLRPADSKPLLFPLCPAA